MTFNRGSTEWSTSGSMESEAPRPAPARRRCGTAATPRACPCTTVTSRPSCSTSAPGCATSALAGPLIVRSEAPRSSPTSTGTMCRGSRSSRRCCARVPARRVRAAPGGRPQRPSGLRRVPPAALLPGHPGRALRDDHLHRHAGGGHRDQRRPGHGPADPPCRTHAGLPGDVGRRVGGLPLGPPAASGRLPPREPRGPGPVRGCGSGHPRCAVHAGRVRTQEHLGPLHGRVRGAGRARGQGQAPGPVPPRPAARRRGAGRPGARRPRSWAPA